MIVRKMKLNLLLYFALICQFTNAQQGIYNVKINQTQNLGYHKIKLSPELVAVSNTDLSDIRILDKSGQQVPYYVVYTKPTVITTVEKNNFEFTTLKSKKHTEFQFKNNFQKTIDQLSLVVNNTKVSKTYSILGSQDNQNWYSIIDKEILTELYDNNTTKIEKTIYLPKTNYLFYKIQINDTISAPIVINEIFNTNNSLQQESLRTQIKDFKLTFLKHGNDNLIHYNSQFKYKIDELYFYVSTPDLFRRAFSITKTENYKKRAVETTIYSNDLNNRRSIFQDINLFENEFKINIMNNDNRPLIIDSIAIYQYPIYLIAGLDSSQSYTINSGDKSAIAPSYDLVNFKDKIPTDLPIVDIEKLEIKNTKLENSSSLKFYQHKWFMWTCLAIGVVVVFSVSISMINSMNKNTV